jgi:hypothetical protein
VTVARVRAGRTSKRVKYNRPWTYPKQAAFLWDGARFVIVEATVKSGKTLGCIIWLHEFALLAPGINPRRNYWWVAPIRAQAKIAFDRMCQYLPSGSFKKNMGELFIDLLNGARIWFKSADNPDSLYGEDVYAVVIDEASRCSEPSWHAIRSTLTATGGPARIIGNVRGRKNWAFRMARQAEIGMLGWSYHKLTAYDAIEGGLLDPAEIEAAKNELPEDVFNELYLAIPSDEGANPFGLRAIRACLVPELSPGPAVSYGIDLARLVDYTVITGLDRAGHLCHFERFQKPWSETIEIIRSRVGYTRALIDSTGVGDVPTNILQNEIVRTSEMDKETGAIINEVVKQCPNVEGYRFTRTSKQQLMEDLGLAIQRQEIHFTEGPGKVILHELESFEYEHTQYGVRYSAPDGMHDDVVCSLALASKARRRPEPVYHEQTLRY